METSQWFIFAALVAGIVVLGACLADISSGIYDRRKLVDSENLVSNLRKDLDRLHSKYNAMEQVNSELIAAQCGRKTKK